MTLERVGDIIAGGFGPRATIGFLIGYLDETTQEEIYDAIKNDRPLFALTEADWEGWRELANKTNVRDFITTAELIKQFRKYQADLLQVVFNHPDGRKWFDKQVTILREKLFQEPPEKE